MRRSSVPAVAVWVAAGAAGAVVSAGPRDFYVRVAEGLTSASLNEVRIRVRTMCANEAAQTIITAVVAA